MYIKQINHRRTFEHLNYNLMKSHNHLGIKKVKRINNKEKEQMILMVETNEILGKEVSAFLKGNILILEAPYQLSFDKPFRTHLVGQEIIGDYEDEVSVIGFSQIELKKGYNYEVLSCQLLNPGLVKIILKCNPSVFKFNHYGPSQQKD